VKKGENRDKKGLGLRRKYAISSLSCTVGKLVLKYYGRRFSHEV